MKQRPTFILTRYFNVALVETTSDFRVGPAHCADQTGGREDGLLVTYERRGGGGSGAVVRHAALRVIHVGYHGMEPSVHFGLISERH
jgi:hypothetical protein